MKNYNPARRENPARMVSLLIFGLILLIVGIFLWVKMGASGAMGGAVVGCAAFGAIITTYATVMLFKS